MSEKILLIIIAGTTIGSMIITWKVFNLFLSLDDAVHLSTFNYYKKKLGAVLAIGLLTFTVVTKILLNKNNDNPTNPSNSTQINNQNQNIQSSTDDKKNIPDQSNMQSVVQPITGVSSNEVDKNNLDHSENQSNNNVVSQANINSQKNNLENNQLTQISQSKNEILESNFKPSFDCTKINLISEKTICSNQMLSNLDNQNSELYKKALLKNHDEAKSIVRSSYHERKSCNDNVECIKQSYDKSIKAYTNIISR